MIRPGEIQTKAREALVRDQQIEKDYILSWILQGVANHEHLSSKIVFKGGTVLKKVYFETYGGFSKARSGYIGLNIQD